MMQAVVDYSYKCMQLLLNINFKYKSIICCFFHTPHSYFLIAYLATARKFLELRSPALLTSPDVAEMYRRAQQRPEVASVAIGAASQDVNRLSSFERDCSVMEHKQSILQRIQGRIVSVTYRNQGWSRPVSERTN